MEEEKENKKPTSKDEPTRWERAWKTFYRVQFNFYLLLVFSLILVLFLWPRIFIYVPSGHNAVKVEPLFEGTVTNKIWGEGLHVILPWDELVRYESRLQEETLTISVLSEEGLELGVSVSIRYRPQQGMLGFLHQDIGPEYFDRLLAPEVAAHIRKTFGSRPALEIYSSAKDVLQELRQLPLLARLDDETVRSANYVDVQEIKIIDIDLPDIVKQAIADKYRQEQLMLEYRYKLQREEKEAERKRIEATGIRDFNSISDTEFADLLRWRDIDAAKSLAESNNSKVIILGGGGKVPLVFSLSGDDPRADDPRADDPRSNDEDEPMHEAPPEPTEQELAELAAARAAAQEAEQDAGQAADQTPDPGTTR